jgi:hypothetical protein
MEGVDYAINTVESVESVPMSFRADQAGLYTIEAIETSEFNEVYLEDLFTGDMVNLLDNNYNFDHNTGSNDNRFVLHFGAVGIEESNLESVQIYSFNENIYVNSTESNSGLINVYNLLGQKIESEELQQGLNVLNINNDMGYYLVEVISDRAVKTAKVYVK